MAAPTSRPQHPNPTPPHHLTTPSTLHRALQTHACNPAINSLHRSHHLIPISPNYLNSISPLAQTNTTRPHRASVHFTKPAPHLNKAQPVLDQGTHGSLFAPNNHSNTKHRARFHHCHTFISSSPQICSSLITTASSRRQPHHFAAQRLMPSPV
jgi:hypothetical protein